MSRKLCCILLLLLVPVLVLAQERVDLSVVNRIRTEEFSNSKAMDYLFYLTDVNGPRLAGSPGYQKAGDWCVKTLQEMGVTNPREEKWGPYSHGWTFTYYAGHMLEPAYAPLIGTPVAWTSGTNGPVTGDAMMAIIESPADMDKFKGQLKGKIVLTSAARDLPPPSAPLFTRYSATELADIGMFTIPSAGGRGGRGGRGAPGQPIMTPEQRRQFQTDLTNFMKAEQPLAVVQNSALEAGIIQGGGASREIKDIVPTVVISTEQYNRIVRLLTHNPPVPVKLQFEVKAQFFEDNTDSFNVVGEIPGGAKKDEVVMIGGHLDSWHYGTGATDNGVGAATTLEVMRVLKALDLKMDRTVRIALWDAEEEGLIGSCEYVKAHFADRDTMALKPEHAKLAAYFNLDNGGGKIRGIYAEENAAARPIFSAWLAPFADLGATVVTLDRTGGTDHQSFDRVGLPGFQFVQDELDYSVRTHHTELDTYEHLHREDLMQAAVIMASFLYDAAMRPERFPRKPLPQASPAKPDKAAKPAAMP